MNGGASPEKEVHPMEVQCVLDMGVPTIPHPPPLPLLRHGAQSYPTSQNSRTFPSKLIFLVVSVEELGVLILPTTGQVWGHQQNTDSAPPAPDHGA